jgi:hypothetical protein
MWAHIVGWDWIVRETRKLGCDANLFPGMRQNRSKLIQRELSQHMHFFPTATLQPMIDASHGHKRNFHFNYPNRTFWIVVSRLSRILQSSSNDQKACRTPIYHDIYWLVNQSGKDIVALPRRYSRTAQSNVCSALGLTSASYVTGETGRGRCGDSSELIRQYWPECTHPDFGHSRLAMQGQDSAPFERKAEARFAEHRLSVMPPDSSVSVTNHMISFTTLRSSASV